MDNPKLLYLSILLIVLFTSYLIAMRDNLPKLIKSASAWVIIFSCFVAGYGLQVLLLPLRYFQYINDLLLSPQMFLQNLAATNFPNQSRFITRMHVVAL